ncbi:MAG: hypothetical protein AAGB93_10250 [Planctomycetota bacterium]
MIAPFLFAPFLFAGALAVGVPEAAPVAAAAPPVSRYHASTLSKSFDFDTRAKLVRRDRALEIVVTNKWTARRTALAFDPAEVELLPGSGRLQAVSVDSFSPYEIVIAGRASGSGEGVLVQIALEMEPLAEAPPAIAEAEVLYQGNAFSDPIAMTRRKGSSSLFLIDRAGWNVVGFFLPSATPYPVAESAAHPDLEGMAALAITSYWVSGEERPRGPKLRASRRPWTSRVPDLTLGQRTLFLADTDRDGVFDRLWGS